VAMVFSKFFNNLQSNHTSNEGLQTSGSRVEQRTDRKKKQRPAKTQHRDEEQGERSGTSDLGKRPPSSRSDSAKKQRPPKRNRGPPSHAALELSSRLKELSQQKNLKEALELYFDQSNDAIRDEHHACIVVDCCSRCGAIPEGEKVVESMKNAGMHVNVETKTALLKGLTHSGQMQKAGAMFEHMCTSRDRPNIRTLNTLLRGCLWTAATVGADGSVSGGVVTSENVWRFYRSQDEEKNNSAFSSTLDSSSYESSISLLCKALRTEEAKSRINELKTFGADKGGSDTEQSVLESLSVSYLGLARAYALLGRKTDALSACRRTIDAAKASRALLEGGGTHKSGDGKMGHGGGEFKIER
jgi:hypothetical protein